MFQSFWWLSNIPSYICHIVFIYTSANRHLGCFQVSAIINSAAMDICVLASLQEFSSFLDFCSGVGSLDHTLTLVFFVWQLSAPCGTAPELWQWKHSILTSRPPGNCRAWASPQRLHECTPPATVQEAPFSPQPSQHLLFVDFFVMAILTGGTWHFIVV